MILHTTFLGLRWIEGFDRRRRRSEWIAELQCPKIALPQDDYDHAAVLDGWLSELGVDVVFTAAGRACGDTPPDYFPAGSSQESADGIRRRRSGSKPSAADPAGIA